MNDITLFTVLSIERLQRLMDLLENWDGPVSVAIGITNAAKELPQVMNAWLNNPKMRRNADIHLLFDDKVNTQAHSSTPQQTTETKTFLF